jgi:hypothetical protein
MRQSLKPSTLTSLLLLLGATPALAAGSAELRASVTGEFVIAPDGISQAELVALDPAMARNLLTLAPGDSILVTEWPVAPGVRQDVELTRFDVYAADARIVKIEGDKVLPLPRSPLAFFQGRSAEDFDTRLVVSIDPATQALQGTAFTREGTHELRLRSKDATGGYLVSTTEAMVEQEQGESPSWACGQQQNPLELSSLFAESSVRPAAAEAITTLHKATIAVDTDNELMQLKFGNSATAATNYIANLIARMTIMYERDFLVRLVQGFTILRPSTTPDPYNQSGTGAADSAKLNEFSSYWSGGCNGACVGVSRALAMMLSGKQNGTQSASGIAWLSSLCSTSTGYSFSQVFKFAQDTSALDGKLVGHELGHNFGSPHTHCYSPPVDTCWNGESCYTGGTSCPAPATYQGVPNVRGTVMSYCHLTGCGSTEVFHPTTINLVDDKIQAKVGQCIFPVTTAPPPLFSNGFETGNFLGWSVKVP